MEKGRPYTKEELDFIRENYKTMKQREIATAIGRTESAIKNKLFSLGLKKISDNERENELKPITGEVWNDVPGFEGIYKASNFGRIRSLMRTDRLGRPVAEKILKFQNDAYGYKIVPLSKDGKTKMYRVHQIIAKTFIPNPDNLPQVNHIDENKANNNLENLEWASAQKNMTHNGLHERCMKKRMFAVLQCALDGSVLNEYENARQAAQKTGLSRYSIKSRCGGQTHGPYAGYIWIYKDGAKRKAYTPVAQYDMNGNKIKEYARVIDAAKELGVPKGSSTILHCIYGRAKTAFGYKWKKIED